jgi:hypothetical protein
VNLKVVQKLPVLEGRGFVHALFVALQTEVKVLVIVFFHPDELTCMWRK